MARSTPAVLAPRLAAILAVSLVACTPPDRPQPQTGFEPSLRSQPDAGDASLHRFEIVSKYPATWLDADSAEVISAGPRCPGGENWDFVDISPKPEPGRVHEQRFPAGTLFSRTWRCAAPFPREITFSHGLPMSSAEVLVVEALDSTGIAGDAADIVQLVSVSLPDRKYDLVKEQIGDIVADAIAVCGDRALRMHAPVIGEWAMDDPAVDRRRGRYPLYIGIRIDCDGPHPHAN